MGGNDESRGTRPRIDAAAKAACLEGLLKGERVRDLAAALGVTPQGLGQARKRDPVFDAGWRAAHAASAAAERRSPSTAFHAVPLPEASSGRNSPFTDDVRIVPNNLRGLQRRKVRHVRFDTKRQEAFLAHFSWSCDTRAAAEAAGVCENTVYKHRRADPAFAEEYQATLEQGYVRLEAEALRQRLAAQQRLRAAVENSSPPPAVLGEVAGRRPDGGVAPPPHCVRSPKLRPSMLACPPDRLRFSAPSRLGEELKGEVSAEFERVMKLLARWDRKERRPDSEAGGGRIWTFEGAIELLDKRLKALGMAVQPLPDELAERYDGPEEGA
jgi:hypothetical protein